MKESPGLMVDMDGVNWRGDRPETDIHGRFRTGMKSVLIRGDLFYPGEMFPEHLPWSVGDIGSLNKIAATDLAWRWN